MTTTNPLEYNQQDTSMPERQLGPGKRQRRPGRRRKKRPTSTEPTINAVDENQFSEQTSRPIAGEPSFDFRLSAEERDTTTRKIPSPPTQSANYKLNRKPYSMLRKDSESESTNSEGRSDLKSLLKQAGGSLSLSEVLQQKNISLADLLNKKQHALAALSKSEASTTPRMDLNSGEMMMVGDDDDKDIVKKHRRVPMFVAMPPHVYPTEELRPPPPQAPPTIATDATSSRKRIPILGPNAPSKPIKEVISRIRPDFSNSKRPTTEVTSNSSTTSKPTR